MTGGHGGRHRDGHRGQPVSVITLVADRAAHLANLVAGLARSMETPGDLVVVDMGSRDEPERALATLGHDLPITWVTLDAGTGTTATVEGGAVPRPGSIRGRRRLPLAAARNLGAETAKTDRLLFLDVDCIPSATTVAAYRAAVERGGLCCGPVRYLDRFWDRSLDPHRTEPAPDVGTGPARTGHPLDRQLTARSSPHPVRPRPAHEVLGQDHELFWSLAFGLHRSTWDRIGGFDPGYRGYGGEDTDFGFRARRAGVPLRWIPTGTVFHQWHRVTRPPVDHLDDIVVNAVRFHRRWGSWPMSGWLDAFAHLGLIDWRPDDGVLRARHQRERRAPQERPDAPSRPTTPAVPTSTPGATGRTLDRPVAGTERIRVLSIPATHPYVVRVLPDDVDAAPDPTDPWWPHLGLDPDWVAANHHRFDLVHLHFGYEHRRADQLDRWCRRLRRLGLGLVTTIHDLHNPHLLDNHDHLARVDVLLARADRVLTLTDGAAREVARRGRPDVEIVPHPHLAPFDRMARPGDAGTAPAPSPNRPLRIGVHLKSFRANTLEPGPLVAGLAAGAGQLDAHLEIRANADADPALLRRLASATVATGAELVLAERLDDADLLDYLAGLDLSVLPYRFGTHSGWLELCRDLGVRVVAPATGHYREQWDDAELFPPGLPGRLDPTELATALVRAGRRPLPAAADPSWRASRLADIRRRHRECYRLVLEGSRP